MGQLAARASAEFPAIRKNITMAVTPLLEFSLGATTPRALWLLLGAVGLLLLIGCVNVANLQLARATARQREMAVRAALGASRYRLVRQTFAESLTLAVIGGVLGAMFSRWMVSGIVAIAPSNVPRIAETSVSLGALAFAMTISVLVAVLFGIGPAVHAARSAPAGAIGESGARTTGGHRSARTRRVLVALELALSVVLLGGAGLAVRSVTHLRRVDIGFTPQPVITASISLPGIRYSSQAKNITFMHELRDRLATAPGIAAAGITTASPMGAGGFYLGRMMVAEGRGPGPEGEISINWSAVTPGYFDALGVPLRRGRDFTIHDDTASAPVMIVNETFASAMFPGENPIGKRAMSSRDEKVYREIVGVVGDMKFNGARDSAQSLVWVPYAQWAVNTGMITVRAREPSSAAVQSMRHVIGELDPTIALANVATMDETMSRSLAGDRLVAILLGVFAALALVLAAIGIFGVLSYAVEQRSRELGIRVALGAQRRDVVLLVARETAPMIVSGVVVGVITGAALSRLFAALFYDVKAGDPVTFGAVALLLTAVAIVAAVVPARRASHVDAVQVLRGE
jgi:predicted permease